MRVALFGGSFNPPHVAHQLACLYVLETAPVDEIWLLPTFRHAFGKELVRFEDRRRMCELMAAPLAPRVVVSDVEARLGASSLAPSRTFDTALALRAERPELELRLMVGEDILAERDAWYRWDDLVELAPLLVVGRSGAPEGAQEVRLPPVSSTEVRDRLRRGLDVSALVPRTVLDYIAGQGLYR